MFVVRLIKLHFIRVIYILSNKSVLFAVVTAQNYFRGSNAREFCRMLGVLKMPNEIDTSHEIAETASIIPSSRMEMAPHVTRSYIVDMLEQLYLLARGANLRHLEHGMDRLLEPYRE